MRLWGMNGRSESFTRWPWRAHDRSPERGSKHYGGLRGFPEGYLESWKTPKGERETWENPWPEDRGHITQEIASEIAIAITHMEATLEVALSLNVITSHEGTVHSTAILATREVDRRFIMEAVIVEVAILIIQDSQVAEATEAIIYHNIQEAVTRTVDLLIAHRCTVNRNP